ncbi:MAG: hypothetical protein ABFC24_03300 [Methanoregulaceae archaeon]
MTTVEPDGTVIVFLSNRKFWAVRVMGTFCPFPDDDGSLVAGGSVVMEVSVGAMDMVIAGEETLVVTAGAGVAGVGTAGAGDVHPAITIPRVTMIKSTTAQE